MAQLSFVALAFSTLAAAPLLFGCGPEAGSPVGDGTGGSTLPVDETDAESSSSSSTGDIEESSSSSTGEPEQCPWTKQCHDLVEVEADVCSSTWAVPCSGGFRCVDTEEEAGIVCEREESSSSEGSTGEELTCNVVGLCEDGCANCPELDCDACIIDANDYAWCYQGNNCCGVIGQCEGETDTDGAELCDFECTAPGGEVETYSVPCDDAPACPFEVGVLSCECAEGSSEG